jgi:phospholipid/cholesterol/gamma-HCH transport system substrate-binding protein
MTTSTRQPPRLRVSRTRPSLTRARTQRLLAIGALSAALIALLVLTFTGGGSHRYRVVFQNAGQLVKGDLVRIGGVPAGTVDGLDLADDGQAEVDISVDDRFAPLRRGTTVTVRSLGIATVASRYVDISPAPTFRPALPDGARIDGDQTKSIVDIDQLFNVLDRPTRRSVRGILDGFATWYAGRETQASESARYFPPALQAATRLFDQIGSDSATLERFLVDTGDALSAVTAHREQLTELVSNARATADALGSDNESLSAALENLPPALRQGSDALAALRSSLGDLRALVDASEPASRELAPFLARTRPVLSRAVPAFRDFRLLFDEPGPSNDLLDALRELPTLDRQTRTVFPQAEKTLAESAPVIGFIRPYSPELIAWIRSFGSATATYDGNGHYARTVPVFDAFDFMDDPAGGSLRPKTTPERGKSPFIETGNLRRCPGASTPPLSDGSAPFVDDGPLANPDCDPTQTVGGTR